MEVSGSLLLWVVNIAYFLGLLQQVILNYKMKTTKGLSDFYLIGYFCGYALNILYVYALDFHISYKTTSPFALLIVTFMIFQRFLYKDSYKLKFYLLGLLIVLFFVPFTLVNLKGTGHVAGWILVLIWCTYQLPQVFRNYSRKSVVGFSFILVSLIGVGNLVELIMGTILDFPNQSIVIAARGLLIYTIFCFQFWKYGIRDKKSSV